MVEVTRRSSSSVTTTTTTTTTTIPSGHRVGWPCVGGGKPRVSRDYSFRAKPACAVESTSDGNDDDDDVLHDSSTTTTTSPYPPPTPPPPPPPPPLSPPPRATALAGLASEAVFAGNLAFPVISASARSQSSRWERH